MDGAVVMAIDGNSLVHRSYHSQAHTGRPTWAVRGLLTQLLAAVERVRPDVVVVGFDDPDHSVRRERWPSYKAQRTEKLDTLVDQLAAAVDVLRELGVAVVVPPGLEADDVLGAGAAWAKRCGATTVVVTSDRDAFALIDDTTRVLRIINGGVDASPMMTAERLVMLLGIRPEQYRDFAALRGDPSDNLPGVRGIGPRTAARLLCEFGTAAAAFADLDGVGRRLGPALARRLAERDARARWELNCRVMALQDVALELELAAGRGVLPLDADRVGRAFRAHDLVWTVSDALRVLAETDAPPKEPPSWVDAWTGFSNAPRLPKLPPRKPAMTQLSLFDVT